MTTAPAANPQELEAEPEWLTRVLDLRMCRHFAHLHPERLADEAALQPLAESAPDLLRSVSAAPVQHDRARTSLNPQHHKRLSAWRDLQ